MTHSTPLFAEARQEFEQMIESIRPGLHRYCTRMTGSSIDAEDVIQEALAIAFFQLPTTEVSNLEGWIFRIAHNKAIDFLREGKRAEVPFIDEFPPPDETSQQDHQESVDFALSLYLQLTPMQRSCVILKDVLGYTLEEVSDMLDVSVGGIKSALNRGRSNLQKLVSQSSAGIEPQLDEKELILLKQYTERFNAREFDVVRTMLAEDVRLDLVERKKLKGEKVGMYFSNYENLSDWYFRVGSVDGRSAILLVDSNNHEKVNNIILLEWRDSKVVEIRDFRYVPYVLQDATLGFSTI